MTDEKAKSAAEERRVELERVTKSALFEYGRFRHEKSQDLRRLCGEWLRFQAEFHRQAAAAANAATLDLAQV